MRKFEELFSFFLVCVLFSFSLCKQSHVSSSSLSHNKHFGLVQTKNFGVCFAKKGEKESHVPENLPSADFNITHTHTLSLSLCVCVCVEKKRETHLRRRREHSSSITHQ